MIAAGFGSGRADPVRYPSHLFHESHHLVSSFSLSFLRSSLSVSFPSFLEDVVRHGAVPSRVSNDQLPMHANHTVVFALNLSNHWSVAANLEGPLFELEAAG